MSRLKPYNLISTLQELAAAVVAQSIKHSEFDSQSQHLEKKIVATLSVGVWAKHMYAEISARIGLVDAKKFNKNLECFII